MADRDEQVQHERTRPQALAEPCLEVNLDDEISRLHEDTGWSTGQTAKTLAKYDDFRVVLTALRAGAHIPGHQTSGRVSIQTVRGHIVVRAEGRTFDLPAGALLVLDRGVTHDVEARADSAFLLTIAWRQQHVTAARHGDVPSSFRGSTPSENRRELTG